jgi:hypothetical protein
MALINLEPVVVEFATDVSTQVDPISLLCATYHREGIILVDLTFTKPAHLINVGTRPAKFCLGNKQLSFMSEAVIGSLTIDGNLKLQKEEGRVIQANKLPFIIAERHCRFQVSLSSGIPRTNGGSGQFWAVGLRKEPFILIRSVAWKMEKPVFALDGSALIMGKDCKTDVTIDLQTDTQHDQYYGWRTYRSRVFSLTEGRFITIVNRTLSAFESVMLVKATTGTPIRLASFRHVVNITFDQIGNNILIHHINWITQSQNMVSSISLRSHKTKWSMPIGNHIAVKMIENSSMFVLCSTFFSCDKTTVYDVDSNEALFTIGGNPIPYRLYLTGTKIVLTYENSRLRHVDAIIPWNVEIHRTQNRMQRGITRSFFKACIQLAVCNDLFETTMMFRGRW